MVGCTRVNKTYIFWFGGVDRVGGCHRVHFVPHYKHPATIVVVKVGGVVCELSAGEGRLAFLPVTLCLVVAKLVTVSALGGVFWSAQSGMVSPPSS